MKFSFYRADSETFVSGHKQQVHPRSDAPTIVHQNPKIKPPIPEFPQLSGLEPNSNSYPGRQRELYLALRRRRLIARKILHIHFPVANPHSPVAHTLLQFPILLRARFV